MHAVAHRRPPQRTTAAAARVLLLSIAAITGWSAPSHAQQAVAGAGTTALTATGVTQGAAMTAGAGTGTLTVGTVGGATMDVFTNNAAGPTTNVAISTDASSTHNIRFNSSTTVYGTLGVTNPGGPFFLNIFGGENNATVNVQGSLFGTILTITGTGSVKLNNGAINFAATNFAGDGTLSLAPLTRLNGALTTTAGAQTGTLSMGGGAVLNGAVGGAIGLRRIAVVGGSSSAGVSATITGAANAYTFDLGTNTLLVDGALSVANGTTSGVVNTTLGSRTVYGNIRPVGFTTVIGSVSVVVTVPVGTQLSVGDTFDIVATRAGTVQSGTSGTTVVITPTNPLYRFAPQPLAGTTSGRISIVVTAIPPDNIVVDPVLVPIVPITDPIVPVIPPSLLPPINAIPDPAGAVEAVAQLAPSPAALAAGPVIFDLAQQFIGLWASRAEEVLCREPNRPLRRPGDDTPGAAGTAAPGCRSDLARQGWWLKGFGSIADQETRPGFVGYEAKSAGLMLAYDAPLHHNDDTHLGFGLGYGRSNVDAKLFEATTVVETYQATAYVAHAPGPWYVYSSLSIGRDSYDGTRHIVFSGFDETAKAGYTGSNYTGYLTAGYHVFTAPVTITPNASLQYTHVQINDYTETGAGDANLHVDKQKYNFAESSLGVEAARPFPRGTATFVPEIHANWRRALTNPSLQSTAAFAETNSAPFTTPGFSRSPNTYNVGLGITMVSAKAWSVEAAYDHDWRADKFTADKVMIKVSSRF